MQLENGGAALGAGKRAAAGEASGDGFKRRRSDGPAAVFDELVGEPRVGAWEGTWVLHKTVRTGTLPDPQTA